MNDESPFIFYCTIWYEWILRATRQVFSIVIYHGNECQNAQWLIACLGKLWKWMKNDLKIRRVRENSSIFCHIRLFLLFALKLSCYQWKFMKHFNHRANFCSCGFGWIDGNLIHPTHHHLHGNMENACHWNHNRLLTHQFRHHQINIIKITQQTFSFLPSSGSGTNNIFMGCLCKY